MITQLLIKILLQNKCSICTSLCFHSEVGWLHCNLVTIKVNQWLVQSFSMLLCPFTIRSMAFLKAWHSLSWLLPSAIQWSLVPIATPWITSPSLRGLIAVRATRRLWLLSLQLDVSQVLHRWDGKMDRGKHKQSGKNVTHDVLRNTSIPSMLQWPSLCAGVCDCSHRPSESPPAEPD